LDSKSNSDSIPVQLVAGIARIVARVCELSLRDLERFVTVVLSGIRARAKLNLLAIPQPRDHELALFLFISGRVTVQSDVTANRYCLAGRWRDYCCLRCVLAHTHVHTVQCHT